MNDFIEGTDYAANVLWQAKPEDDHWISTGRDELFITQIDLRGVLGFYIERYPGTHVIRGVICGNYFASNLADMARSLMLDSVVTVIQRSPSGKHQQQEGGTTMEAPPDTSQGQDSPSGRHERDVNAP